MAWYSPGSAFTAIKNATTQAPVQTAPVQAPQSSLLPTSLPASSVNPHAVSAGYNHFAAHLDSETLAPTSQVWAGLGNIAGGLGPTAVAVINGSVNSTSVAGYQPAAHNAVGTSAPATGVPLVSGKF